MSSVLESRDGVMRLLHSICLVFVICSGCSTWTISPDRALPRLNEMAIPTESTRPNAQSTLFRDERPQPVGRVENSQFRFSDLPETPKIAQVKFDSEVGSGVGANSGALMPANNNLSDESSAVVVVESQLLNLTESSPMQRKGMLVPTDAASPKPPSNESAGNSASQGSPTSSNTIPPIQIAPPEVSKAESTPSNGSTPNEGAAKETDGKEPDGKEPDAQQAVVKQTHVSGAEPAADSMLIDPATSTTESSNPTSDDSQSSAGSGMFATWCFSNVVSVCGQAVAGQSKSDSTPSISANETARSSAGVMVSSAAAHTTNALPSLQVCQGQFCTEIRGYGQYDRMEDRITAAGQPMLIYCELENFESMSRSDERGTEFETRLQATLTIYDGSGRVQQEIKFPEHADVARKRRRDFYLHIPFMVGQLPRGHYEATVTIEDRLSKQTASLAERLPFEVR